MLDALCYGLRFEIAFDENLEDVAPILFFGNAIDSSFEVFERTEIVEESPCGPRTSKASFSKVCSRGRADQDAVRKAEEIETARAAVGLERALPWCGIRVSPGSAASV